MRSLCMSRGSRSLTSTSRTNNENKAKIVVIGAGWWSQGWHLPHLSRNENVEVAAIVDTSKHPSSSLNPNLEPLSTLSKRYSCPVFQSVPELLNETSLGPTIDGAIVCTPHSTHYEIGRELLQEGMRRQRNAADGQKHRPMNILMEKPMTTSVKQAQMLRDLAIEYTNGGGCFLVNNSANYRTQTRTARDLVDSGEIGSIRHVSGFMASPLSWIFDDPSNRAWNEVDPLCEDMVGNGFAYGQSSHLLAWLYHVGYHDLIPERVFCAMNHSERTGADVSHSGTIICEDGVNISLSGTSLLPGNAHSDPPVGKRIRIKIFGTKGAIMYSGNDQDVKSGKLELAKECGTVEIACPDLDFDFENLDTGGTGPESLQSFISACLGQEYYVGADVTVGMRSVQTIDAMYRSCLSGSVEDVTF